MYKMNCPAGKCYMMLSAVFCMCRVMGVLPLKRRACIERHPLHLSDSNKGFFELSRWGILFSMAHILLLLFCYYQREINWSNLLTLHGLFWTQNISSALISILVSLSWLPSLSDQLSTAYTIYYLYSHKTKSFSYFFSFLLVQPFIPMLYELLWVPFIDYDVITYFLQVNYVTTNITATQVIISSLCFIVTNAYKDINQQLVMNQKLKINSKSITLVKQQLDNYILVSKFVKSFSAHFGTTFLNTFISLISRTIVFVVFAVLSMKGGKYYDILIYTFTNAYIVFCVFFMCYYCQRVKEEQQLALIIVRRIRVLWIGKITEDEAFLLDTYEELMEVSAVEFTACGLFPVNIEQCLHVLGIIVTYGLAAAQAP